MNKSNIFAAAVSGMVLASSAMADHHEKKAEPAKKPESKKAEAKQPEAKAGEDMKVVKCSGINGCKGQSKCSVDGAHTCAGLNSCKNKGWIELSMKECTAKKGKVVN